MFIHYFPPDVETKSITEHYDSQSPSIVPLKNISKKIKIINQLNSFSHLKENWDSYDASVISNEIIQEAIEYVKKLDKKNVEIYFTAPSPQGDILLELKNKNKSIEIEFLSDNKKIYSIFESEIFLKSDELNDESEEEFLEWYNK